MQRTSSRRVHPSLHRVLPWRGRPTLAPAAHRYPPLTTHQHTEELQAGLGHPWQQGTRMWHRWAPSSTAVEGCRRLPLQHNQPMGHLQCLHCTGRASHVAAAPRHALPQGRARRC